MNITTSLQTLFFDNSNVQRFYTLVSMQNIKQTLSVTVG